MKNIESLIIEVKEKLNFDTFQKTMEYLDMKRQAWTAIQKGAGVNEKNAIRIGKILDMDPIEIMAISQSLRAKNKESRDLWLKLVKEKENQRLSKK